MNIQFKLTPEEVSVLKIVSTHHKFKHFKDAKTVYMNSLKDALKVVAPNNKFVDTISLHLQYQVLVLYRSKNFCWENSD